MATAMTAPQIRSQMTRWKVPVLYYSGYETRGGGVISNAQGIVIHHTGSDAQTDGYLRFLFVDGRSDVPPPLCNGATRMNGQLVIGAVERANHAGMGSSATLSKVQGTTSYDWRNTEIEPGPDNINGNGYYYGNEVMFDGGQPITATAWKSIILWCAAICEFHGWTARRIIGHKEHTGRKVDPGNTLMYLIRRDVDAALRAGPGNWPEPEDDMSDADVAAINAHTDQQIAALEARLYAGPRYQALQDTGNRIVSTLDNFISVMQGRYSLAEQREAEDRARDTDLAQDIANVLTPLQALKDHEDVDDVAVRNSLDDVIAAVAELKEMLEPDPPQALPKA